MNQEKKATQLHDGNKSMLPTSMGNIDLLPSGKLLAFFKGIQMYTQSNYSHSCLISETSYFILFFQFIYVYLCAIHKYLDLGCVEVK